MIRIILVLGAALLGLFSGSDAHAQSAGQLPSGSWAQTCPSIVWEGDIIVARCHDTRGQPAYTRWDTRSGVAVVQNCNGDLVGAADCRNAASMHALGGSWRREPCDFARFDGSVMVAYCYYGGESRELRYDLARGSGPLELCGGELVIEGRCHASAPRPEPRPSPNPTPSPNMPAGFPSGSWQHTCTNARWEDRLLVANCQTSRGGWVRASFDTNLPFFTLSNCDGRLVASADCGSNPGTTPPRPNPPAPVTPAPAPRPTPQPASQPAQASLPGGSWTEHCRNSRVERELLITECHASGQWVQSNGRYVWQAGEWRSYQRSLRGYNGPLAFCDGDLVRRGSCD
ncbi:MAG: CVNH domain-containing protein [Alphaproteobacteria bacterium]|uniref:hypothetical protein n=1 Tax=Maricaulis alexandrii TaxID=2570354 RepID=UPI0011092A2B|nr:hypothetical protein [Maricaulis alexandrii]MCR9267230.1 CVNH domain-containing protein [Alphaproteobacteria bacterium]